jgi:nitrate/nitrite transporter NarK
MLSDRFGRARLTSSFMLVSAACAFALGWAGWIAAFALSALVALMGPLAVGFKEFSRRPVAV